MDLKPKHGRSRTVSIAAALPALVGLLALPAAPAPEDGEPVPEVRAVDLDGNVHTLADFPGRVTLFLFWQPDLERSRQALCAVAELASGYEPAALATIVPGPHSRDEIKQALGTCRRQPTVLLDPERKIAAAFQIIAQPAALLIGPDRRLQFKVAGFGSEGIGAIQGRLDEIYGRRKPPAATPAGSPQALHHYALAQQLLKVGATAQAEAALQSLTAEHPEFRPGWVALGYRRLASGQVDEAKAFFEKAVALDPKELDVAAGLAWVWWKKGDAARSAKWAECVKPEDPNYGWIAEIRK